MASIELGSLADRLESEEVSAISSALEEADIGALEMDEDAESVVLERDFDGDLFADFVDQLDANEASCDIYLPLEFDDTFDAAGYTVGSAHALVAVLEDMRDEMFVGEEEDEPAGDADEDFLDFDDDDEEAGADPFSEGDGDALQVKEERMRHLWKVLYRGAHLAIDRQLALFLKS